MSATSSHNHSDTYLVERQRDPARLKRKAFEEFRIAVRGRRMIAITGSYATAHLGYPDWQGAAQRHIENLQGRFKSGSAEWNSLDRFVQLVSSTKKFPAFDLPDLMESAELVAGFDRHLDAASFREMRTTFAEQFIPKRTIEDCRKLPSIESALIHDLGIRRFITLNYDLELERASFLSRTERREWAKKEIRGIDYFRSLTACRVDDRTGKAERVVPGFGKVSSEVMDGSDAAQLTSFALGEGDERVRILHLHGRQDKPESIVLSRRDYRERYWEAGFSKLPFEYGLRTVFAGNPILFVGLGMSEFEVTRTLQQLLSDNPNRRAVPMFILWNSTLAEDDHSPESAKLADDALRLMFYRKFGVHVLFDQEVSAICDRDKEYAEALRQLQFIGDEKWLTEPHFRKSIDSALRLERPLQYLATWSRDGQNAAPASPEYREAQRKFDAKNIERINIWHASENRPAVPTRVSAAAKGEQRSDDDVTELFDALRSKFIGPVVALVGKPGSGRGAWAEVIADTLIKRSAGRGIRVVALNGSFATETDSIFAILSGAFDGQTARTLGQSRFLSAAGLFDKIARGAFVPIENEPGELCLIINGIERFIAQDGSSLSTEMDVLLRLIPGLEDKYVGKDQSPKIRLFLIGTARLERYLNLIAPGRFTLLPIERRDGTSKLVLPSPVKGREPLEFAITSPSFFEHLSTKTGVAPRFPLTATSSQKRREYLAQIAAWIDENCDRSAEALELLRILAFIGQPTELSVLPHLLRISVPSIGTNFREAEAETRKIVKRLLDLGLLLEIDPFPDQGPRVGVHKALVAELRQQYGAPLTESRLAAGFNIGLYAAQAMDNIVPELRWHSELAKFVDFLIGQFNDEWDADECLLHAASALSNENPSWLASRHLDRFDQAKLARMASCRQSECLRAALSLTRSFFSTSALLMHGNRGLDPRLKNGPLTDHAEQLQRMIRTARHSAELRSLMLDRSDVHAEEMRKAMGAPAFYPDDLVWLHNELGVVFTAQGRLNEARDALDEALHLNKLVEFDEHRQNWRRISLNLVQVLIDQGELAAAEERLNDIESALEDEATKTLVLRDEIGRGLPGDCPRGLRKYLRHTYVRNEKADRSQHVDPYFPTSLILGCALVTGYRALCLHLRGDVANALVHYDDALQFLLQIGEQRAYAIFQRHRSSLLAQLKRLDEAKAALRLCISASGPSRHADIDHSARIARADLQLAGGTVANGSLGATTLPQMKETLRYAVDSDMYRLQLETMQVIAAMHLRNGDTDSALQYASDAMAIASRHGFGLRKVSLRILQGRILASRNKGSSARQLLEEGARIASGLGYARAAEAAEDQLVMLDIDSVSAGGMTNGARA